MSNKFNQKEVEHLLAKCHRRCCICHRFCGVKIETDHIIQPKDGGDNSIANAIPVCFECHPIPPLHEGWLLDTELCI